MSRPVVWFSVYNCLFVCLCCGLVSALLLIPLILREVIPSKLEREKDCCNKEPATRRTVLIAIVEEEDYVD